MRIDRLELLAYGPFTDKVLDFSGRPRALQLVYGPNEAGKSSTLRALVGLLYGIETRTQDAHQHDMNKLRIGATLVDEQGHALRVVRRKGAKNTLLDPLEQPLGEGALTPLLGGLDQALFRQMFGLDHERLREGAEALLRGGGQLGEVLFDASTGGRGVHTLIEELRAQADALFKVRGRTPELNAALDSLKDKKKARNDAVLLPQAYADQLTALAEARAARDRSLELRRALGAERSRLTRLLQLVPLLAKRDALSAQLEPADAAVQAGNSHEDALHEETVQELNRRFGSVLASARDEPSFRTQREALAREVDERRERLKHGLSGLGELDTVTRTRVRKLVEELRALCAERAELLRLEAAAHEEQVRLDKLLAQQPAAAAPGLAVLLLALEKEDLLGQLTRSAAEQDKLSAQLQRRHQQLALSLELEVLARTSLPDAALLDGLERTLEQLQREQEHLRQERGQRAEQHARLVQQRAELLLRGELASRAELERARAQRDAAFDVLFEGTPSPAAVRAFAAASERADTLADRMVREAQEAAELARIDLSLAQLASEQRALEVALQAAVQAAEEQTARWQQLAAPLGLSGHTPRRARPLLLELGLLREQLADRRQLALGHAGLVARAEQRSVELEALLSLPPADASGPHQRLELVTRRAHEQLALEQERARSQALLRSSLDKLDTERTQRRGRATVVEGELAAAQARFQAELTRLGLSSELTPDELQASFEELTLLATRTRELDTLTARLEAAERTRELLTRDVQAVAERFLPAAAEPWSLEAALSALAQVQRERAQAARDRKRQHEERAAIDAQLLELGDGHTLAELRAQLESFEPHQARARLEELEGELEEQTHALSDLEQSIGRLSGGMETLESGSGAVALAEDYEHELSRARALTRRYVEARLALALLSSQVERYRSEHQQPVLKRASELFPRLTLHRYRGLTVELNEQDEPVLSCVVASGRTVRIEALSDGTRDQLYLALRVASIERYFEGRPPLPLILDDALIHFDDARAGAALEVLGELTRHTQVLFFTHHARMVELARHTLGDAGVSVHELSGRSAPRSDGPLFESPPS
jgi:uncharacterized protein YhaN